MQQLSLFIPPSDWRPVETLPEIPAGIPISVDLETRDDGIARAQGAGWAWYGGHIAGVAVAWAGEAVYLPLAHPETANLPPGKVYDWLREVMRRASEVVFHNAPYDLGWLGTVDFDPDEYRIEDTQAMAVLIDENRLSYSLDNLCKSYGIPGKDKTLLLEAGASYGFDKKEVMNNLWKLPAKYVGPYAAQDTLSTLALRNVLKPILEDQELDAAYRLEMDIMPCTIAMRRQGIRLDLDEAQRVQNFLSGQTFDILGEVRRQVPPSVQPKSGDEFRSPKAMERLFAEVGLEFPRTLKTKQGQFKSEWLKAHEHPVPRLIAQWRALDDLRNKFIGTYILENSRAGRIHAEIHQLRDDDGGTRSYRFSYANPPLQQMPARDEGLAPLIRGIFLPEPDELWLSADYSQQEPRMAVHFAAIARLPGYEEAVAYYRDNAKADFHSMVAEITGIPRPQAKIINLAVMYGMGRAKLALRLGITEEEADDILKQYNSRMPFVSELMQFCTRRAESRGYVRLLDGARCRWDLWQVNNTHALPYDQAKEMQRKGLWRGTLRRAYTHKAMNRLCQGSAARQTKMAMRLCWQEGLMPKLQMHDELAFSVNTHQMGKRVAEIMRECITLQIPVAVDEEYGISWGKSMKKGANDYESAARELASLAA